MAVLNKQPLQFGLRGMLLLVALLSAGLGLGIYFAILVVAIYFVSKMFANGKWKLAVGILVAMLTLTLLGVGVFVQIRLDTGDERIVIWGIPTLVQRMQPEQREALLSIRRQGEPVRWSWCASSVASSRPDTMVRSMYKSAALWVKEDPAAARVIVGDLGEYVRSTHGTHGLPESCMMLGPDVLIWEGRSERIADDWRNIPEVQAYLKRKGIPAAVALED